MRDYCAFEITEVHDFEFGPQTSNMLQARLMQQAYEIASIRGFPHLLCSHFYLFRENDSPTHFSIECDILDSTDRDIAIECYLYKKNGCSFYAKSFAVFSRLSESELE